ncbi:MAG TPA: tetratricopeptide repeat protein [Vicinamibacterales bacterium]|nr:tetratricopeptide repeat protein [Vicinamibacterales bacterium]
MTPERWQQIQTLLGAALERAPEERPSYVEGACGNDTELLHEVESLLKQASAGSGFLSTPAFDIATQPASHPRLSLVGRVIGPFSIKRRLDSGGMGDVYLADDAALRRLVAVKALREFGPPTPEARERLLREARHAAALNHPNIATIFHVLDAVDAETPPLMVMEYVEGETIAERLRRGPLPLDQALRFTRDVADALAAAHALDIVHRDLKPANLRVNQQERIKVLDFGLARQLAPAVDTSTMTVARITHSAPAHRIAGTPGYAAPEQALGLAVGRPADIFGLGVVLYEMLTGRRPFPGDELYASGVGIMAMPTPRVADVIRGIPPFVDALLGRMLAKDPDARPSAQEIVEALSPVTSTNVVIQERLAPSRRAMSVAALATIVALAAGGSFAWWRTSRAPAAADRPVIAVLPLTNLSGDSAKDYLGVGIAETLTTSLARVPHLSVVSRTGLADARRNADVQTIARDVGATLVLQGSVQQSGDRLRVSAKLLRPDGSVAWAGDADAPASDLFSLETRLAASIISGLPIPVAAAAQQTAVAPATGNREALEAYWQGLAFLDRQDRSSVSQAIASLEKATQLDSHFAAPYGALGEAYRLQYRDLGDKAAIDKASAAIERGLAIDPEHVEVRISLATLYMETGRAPAAAAEFREIIRRHPENDEAHSRLAAALARMGKPDEALVEYQTAVALRPQYWRNHQALAGFLLNQKRMPEAIQEFTRVIEIRPDDANAYLQRGAAFGLIGNNQRARADFEQSNRLMPNPSTYSNLGVLAFEEHRYVDAAQAFAAAIRQRPNRAMYHRNLGDAYLKLNRVSDARAEYATAVALTEDALRVNATDATTLSQLALYEAKAGRAKEARQHADQAVALDSANADVLFRKGVTLTLVGDTEAAVNALRLAVEHGYGVQQLRTEDDLARLAGVPAFQQLVNGSR